MTYADFLARSLRLQTEYVLEQTGLMLDLLAKRAAIRSPKAYKAAAFAMGFHDLTKREITKRLNELKRMARDVRKTHGDTPTQRACWSALYANAA